MVLVSANPSIARRLSGSAPTLQWNAASYADILRKDGLVLPDVTVLLLLDVASRNSFYCGGVAHVCTLLYRALQRCTERGDPTMIVARRYTQQEFWKTKIIVSVEAIRKRTLQLPVPGITRAAYSFPCVHIRSTGEKQKMSSRGQLNEFESS